MTRCEQMLERLRIEAKLGATNATLLHEAADVLEGSMKLHMSLLVLIHQEGNWRIPLSDGVRAEVTIYGSASAAHVKAFAKTFSLIADGYIAPAASTEPSPETLANSSTETEASTSPKGV